MFFSLCSALRLRLIGGLAAVVVFGVFALPIRAQSQEGTQQEIRELLEERDQEIKSILSGRSEYTDEQRARLKELINGVIDFRAMAKTALGPHWDTLGTNRRDQFVEVFQDVVRAQSMGDLDVYNSKVTYDQITVRGDSAFVRTITEYKGTKTPVEYVLTHRSDTWKAEDIIVDGVSTAEGYARSFQSVLRKRGFGALMTALEKKRKETSGTQD